MKGGLFTDESFEKFKEFIEGMLVLFGVPNNKVLDENGNILEFESTLRMGDKSKEFDIARFEPEKIDISREMQWLLLLKQAEDIINGQRR